jgi:hypothetical protein
LSPGWQSGPTENEQTGEHPWVRSAIRGPIVEEAGAAKHLSKNDSAISSPRRLAWRPGLRALLCPTTKLFLHRSQPTLTAPPQLSIVPTPYPVSAARSGCVHGWTARQTALFQARGNGC